MEGRINEHRRVYSVEPRKTMQASFARKYVNYLVPALAKISKEISPSSEQCIDKEIEKIVRYEVDMALALSAEGFAWSHALKDKLQLNIINNVGRFQTSLTHHHQQQQQQPAASFKISSSACYSSSHIANMVENEVDYNQNAMPLNKISYLNQESASEKLKTAKRTTEMEAVRALKEEEMRSEEEEEEEDVSRRRMTYLRKLLPGGSEMVVDDEILLSELGSYVSCLEFQVNILRSMVDINYN